MTDVPQLDALHYNDRYFQFETPDTVAVFGHLVEIDASFTIGAKHLIVRAYEVHLSKNVSVSGKDVAIVCRRLVCAGSPHIDVSGADAENPASAADTATTAGQAGVNGEAGKAGAAAGSIVIVAEQLVGDLKLSANGGRGGAGQNGGNGAVGARGENKPNGKPVGTFGPDVFPEFVDGQPGGDGKPGGDAGAGAAGGAGGNAGAVRVRLASAPKNTQLKIAVEPGPGGAGGISGTPGQGGKGGLGGLLLKIVTKAWDGGDNPGHGKDPGFYKTATLSKQRAAEGKSGPLGRAKPNGTPGAPGQSHYGTIGAMNYGSCVEITSMASLRPALVLPQLRMAVFAAEQAYLADDGAKTDEILDWARRVLAAPGDLGSDTLAHDPANAKGDADDRMALTLLSRVGALRDQRARGLDAFGMAVDYVPQVSRDHWSKEVDESLKSLAAAEKAFSTYKQQYKDIQVKKAACVEAMEGSEKANEALEREMEALRTHIGKMDELIGQLVAAELDCAAALEGAAQDFRDAVEAFNRKKGGRCDFGATLKVAGMIASVATGAHGAFVAFSGALALAKESKPATPDVAEAIGYLYGVAGKVEEGIDGVQAAIEAYNACAAELARKPLLVMTESQVQALLDEYKHLPEAHAYRAWLDELMAKARAKNEAIVTRDAMAARVNAALTEKKARKLESEALMTHLASANDPTLVQDALFMGKIVDERKRDCLWLLRMEHRSLVFWRLSPTPFAVNTASAATLRATHDRIRSEVNRELEMRTASEQRFATAKRIRWTKDDAEEGWVVRSLIERGATSLRIQPTEYALAGFWATVVERVEVWIHGARVADDILQVRLTHLGDGRSYDAKGQVVTHTYRPRTIRTEYNVTTGEISTPGNLIDPMDLHAQLTPYGTWRLEVPSDVNEDLDLSGVEAIELCFAGYRRAL